MSFRKSVGKSESSEGKSVSFRNKCREISVICRVIGKSVGKSESWEKV